MYSLQELKENFVQYFLWTLVSPLESQLCFNRCGQTLFVLELGPSLQKALGIAGLLSISVISFRHVRWVASEEKTNQNKTKKVTPA